MESDTLDNLGFDDASRIKTNVNQRTDHKRVFAAGDCSSTYYYVNNFQAILQIYNMKKIRIVFLKDPMRKLEFRLPSRNDRGL